MFQEFLWTGCAGMECTVELETRFIWRGFPKISQSPGRPLWPSPGWKRLVLLSHLRNYKEIFGKLWITFVWSSSVQSSGAGQAGGGMSGCCRLLRHHADTHHTHCARTSHCDHSRGWFSSGYGCYLLPCTKTVWKYFPKSNTKHKVKMLLLQTSSPSQLLQ